MLFSVMIKIKLIFLVFTDNITLIIRKILPILDEIQNIIGKKNNFIKKGLKVKKDVITLCCNHKNKCFLNGYELFLCFDKIIILYIKNVESFINVKPITNNDNVKLLKVYIYL